MKNFRLTIVLAILFNVPAVQCYSQWIEQDPGFPEDMTARAYSVVDPEKVWLVGGRALDSPPFHGFSRSLDGGQTWIYNTLDLPGLEKFHFTDICALSDSLAWVSMMDGITYVHKGRILKTTDGGQNWVHQSTAYPDDPVLAHIPDIVYFFDENDGITAGEFGEIYITENGGDLWTLVSSQNIPDLIGNEETLAFNKWSVGDSTLWFGTTKGRVFKTSNRGRSWEAYDVGLGISNVYASFQDELTGFATAPLLGKNFAKSTDGGKTWKTLDYQLPSNGVLMHVSGTRHTYMFGSSGFATYLGKDPHSGIHTITFDASNLASGVYYYNMISNERSQSRKMQIIKR